jgi:hypothetical protein
MLKMAKNIQTEYTEAQSKSVLIKRLKRNGVFKCVTRIKQTKKPSKGNLGMYKIKFLKQCR